MSKIRLAVIGAGVAGLSAARYGVEFGCEVTVFEQANQLGGTWVYTDDTGRDQYGIDVHTSMYRGLRTNLPKEIMCFPGFPFPDNEKSFVTSEDVLNYIKDFANKFNLKKLIKFEHHVILVRPKENNSWEIIVKDLPSDRYETYNFDAVLVCNGHYSKPNIAKIEGCEIFGGRQLHVHDFRNSNAFKNERILIIGAGPSALDMCVELSKIAERVTLSHHSKKEIKLESKINQKPDIARLTKNGAIFTDGSAESYSVILYCTGYKFSFPFLSVECDVSCQDNYLSPLYKHCISINHPTMAFIGIPSFSVPAQMSDLQSRFCLTFITGIKTLPTKMKMFEDMDREMQKQWNRGLNTHNAHMISTEQMNYFTQLAEAADIDPIKPVVVDIHLATCNRFFTDFETFRNEKFKIVDDKNYVKTL